MGFSTAIDRSLFILRCLLLLVSNLSLTASNIVTLLYVVDIMIIIMTCYTHVISPRLIHPFTISNNLYVRLSAGSSKFYQTSFVFHLISNIINFLTLVSFDF